MRIEVRILLDLPDKKHTKQELDHLVQSEFGLRFLSKQNPFFAERVKKLYTDWKYVNGKAQ